PVRRRGLGLECPPRPAPPGRLPARAVGRRDGRRIRARPAAPAARRGTTADPRASRPRPRDGIRDPPPRERLRRSGAVVHAGERNLHGPLLPRDDEVSALAPLSADDARPRARGAPGARAALGPAGPRPARLRARPALLLRAPPL